MAKPTESITINQVDGWVPIGTGPLRIQILGKAEIHYGDVVPDISTVGHIEAGNVQYSGFYVAYAKVQLQTKIITTEV